VNYFVNRYSHTVWILLNFISTQNYGLIQVGGGHALQYHNRDNQSHKRKFSPAQSIAAQQYNDIEVIFADQNNDDRLNPILAQYRLLFPILHLRSQKGLSRSRNEALAFAQGEIICFPDDDCWYPPNLLIEVDRRMRENPLIAGFTGRCTDEHGRLSAGGESRRPGLLNRHNVWRGGVSATMFLRSNVLKQVGGFDEELVWSGNPVPIR